MITLGLIGKWRTYKKLGYKGWVMFIPFYNTFCIFEGLYDSGWLMFLPFLISLIAGTVVFFTLMFDMEFRNRIIFLAIEIAFVIVIFIYLYFRIVLDLTHSFGKKGWWSVGTFFFLPLFFKIYGLSDCIFRERSYPYPETYDTFDGFVDFFRRQREEKKKEIVVRRCRNCGAPLRSNSSFCSECGASINS